MAENGNDTDSSSADEDDFDGNMDVREIHPFFAGVNKTRVCNQELADFPAMSFYWVGQSTNQESIGEKVDKKQHRKPKADTRDVSKISYFNICLRLFCKC